MARSLACASGPGFSQPSARRSLPAASSTKPTFGRPAAASTGERTAIVNESFARRYFKDRSPVGYRIGLGNRPDAVTNIEIVGVVKDIGFRDLRDAEREKVYFHYLGSGF